MFSGFDKSQRAPLMKEIWDLVKHYYTCDEIELLLNLVNHKDTFKNATSRKFKSDLFEFFKDDKYKKMKVLELGACRGDTTRIFAEIFKKVFAVDRDPENIQILKQKCKDVDNVEASIMDVTNDIWDTSGTQALSSTAIIPVATLANDIKEIQTVEDIGEFVGLYSGTNLQAILPLGGGTVKINLPSTTVVGLKSLTGTDITSGKIAINFLG